MVETIVDGPLSFLSPGRAVADDTVLHAIRAEAASFCQQPRPSGSEALVVVETAGGVASPSPSGSLQCDLLRPLRLPAILVGDSRLGGISATIAALETLQLRGIDTAAVVMIGVCKGWKLGKGIDMEGG